MLNSMSVIGDDVTSVMIKMNAILAEVAFMEMQMKRDEVLRSHAVSEMAVDDVNWIVEVDVGVTRDERAREDAWHILEQ